MALIFCYQQRHSCKVDVQIYINIQKLNYPCLNPKIINTKNRPGLCPISNGQNVPKGSLQPDNIQSQHFDLLIKSNSKATHVYFGFSLLCSVIIVKTISRHFLAIPVSGVEIVGKGTKNRGTVRETGKGRKGNASKQTS